MYSKCCSIEYAQQAFNELSDKNAQSWNTMLSAYSQKGLFEKTFQLLDVMPDPNGVSFNSIISSLTHHGFSRKAMGFFKRMQTQCGNGFLIDEFTVVSVVNTCAGLGALNLLRELHGFATVIGVRFNLVVCNALIDAYGKCGKPECVLTFLSYVDHKCGGLDCSGFAQNGEGDKALCTFKEMLEEGIVPRASTYVGVLSSCADIPLIEKVNALVDMYSKCGDMISAMRLFERLDGKDRVTWNSIINGFAQNGNGVMSLFMFEKMIEIDTTPNHVTFLGVLSACSHCGLLSEGFQYLHSMERKYDIVPQLDHYAILIDLLGRKNMLGEAADLIKRAPWGRDNIGMWGALLGACSLHGNLKLARRVAEDLFELEPDNAARYIMLSNIYAAAGR
ncbi:pentatricopeptide repeat-containing protein At1g08070, chloroplastic-like [Nicotiana sylvestris]|uniref:pentatricopeptide repeat-containing protein At1g08070, chloroplastic-like n=1 Tax=Nicotiana sylvestris TaxID=4096 RepID=UPI00388C5E69